MTDALALMALYVARKSREFAEKQERAIIAAIESGERYAEVPTGFGGSIVFDVHSLDRDATGVPR